MVDLTVSDSGSIRSRVLGLTCTAATLDTATILKPSTSSRIGSPSLKVAGGDTKLPIVLTLHTIERDSRRPRPAPQPSGVGPRRVASRHGLDGSRCTGTSEPWPIGKTVGSMKVVDDCSFTVGRAKEDDSR